jgi:hypothetical protein
MNKLNKRYPQKQVQPITLRNKEITDDKKIANYFNTYFSNAHKLTNDFKKQEKSSKEMLGHLRTTLLRKFFTRTFQKRN